MKKKMNKVLWGSAISVCVAFLLVLFPLKVNCAEKPIVIGVPLPLGNHMGQASIKSITLAVEEINAMGGVNIRGAKRPFVLEVEDDRSLEADIPISQIILTVEKLILQKKVDFLIGGPSRSEASFPLMDLLYRYKKVGIIGCCAKSPAIHARVAKDYDKYKYYFKMSPPANELVRTMTETIVDLKFKEKHGLNTVYIMNSDVAAWRALAKGMTEFFSKEGYTIVGSQQYPTGATDYSMGLLEAKEKGAKLLFIAFDVPTVTFLIKQWHDLKIPVLVYGMASPLISHYAWEATGGKVEYVILDACDPASGGISYVNERMSRFFNAHIKRWGVPPEIEGSQSYEAVYVLKDALERAGTLESEAVVKAIEQTNMVGVNGRIKFDPKAHIPYFSNNPEAGGIDTAIQWVKGERVAVWPKSVAKDQIKLPSWMK